MNSLSVMEWNVKTPSQWDWDNLIMLNATTEIPRKPRPTEWELDRGMDSGSLISFGAGVSGGSGSDLGLASLSKSSKSASINSSLGEVKGNKFTLEGFEGIPNDFSYKKDFAKVEQPGKVPVEASVGCGEPLLGLKLGKRTYFEDVCAGNNAKSSSSSVIPASSVVPAKRSKASCQNTNAPHCQVEGCNLDLSSAKDYHRKHRVCENHSKSPKVIVGGLERRFCQQCSRFHGLSEFDEKKRSCRRRLSDHNARRRKPQTEAVTFNPARLSASPYNDGKHEISFVCNAVPFFHPPNENFVWEGSFSSKSAQMKGHTHPKVESINGELQLPGNEAWNPISKRNHDSSGFELPKGKRSATEVLIQDVEESTISSNMGIAQDLQRALSLLSTDSWGSCEPKQGSLDYSMHTNNTDISQPVMHTISQGFPLALSENSQIEQQSTASQVQTTLHGDADYHFQEFQLLRAPYDSGFYSSRIN